MGCGNPYDYILVDVATGDALMVCVPCFIKQAADMVTAFLNPYDPEVTGKIAFERIASGDIAPGPRGKPRGKNAPADSDDPGLFEAYDSVITADELPEAFR
jgi:hypothetical protein